MQDTIATTAKAASTDSRGSACLPQSAPTVQAQVSHTAASAIAWQSCQRVRRPELQHNHVETQCAPLACDSREGQGAEAGLPVAPDTLTPVSDPSVIASLSCQSVRPSCPNLTPVDAGNSNIKSNNKMQSVNVTFSTNLNKGNDNCLLIECNTAVTVPNTKLQRNTDGSTAANNNSYKLDVVNVYDKNYGALNRLSMEPASQCRSNQIPGFDIPECSSLPLLNKSEYLKPSDNSYNDDYVGLERLIALNRRTKEMVACGRVPHRLLGLYGGGESSLSTGTTGWGTPPGTNTNNNNGKSQSKITHTCHFCL